MAPALFVSDLHLSAERPAVNDQFFAFLRERAPGAQALYVLGDLFDYWIGDDELQASDADPLARRVTQAFGALAASGVEVKMMHGNRDFLLGPCVLGASGATLVPDPCLLELQGVPTLLLHGDTLCTDDVAYQQFRAQARSEAWQREFLGQALGRRRELMQELRAKSEAVKSETAMAIMDVNPAAVEAAFRRHGVRRMIHGHTHRPACHVIDVDGRRCERWVLPAWYDGGGYLEVRGESARLVDL